jgi:CRISPR-associated protein Cmr3
VRAYGPEHARSVVFPTVESFKEGEGWLLPEGTPPMDALIWELPSSVRKSAALDEFVSLDIACKLLLQRCETLRCPERPVEFEGRVHVTINMESQTAEPAALYSSPGVRYADDVAIGVEVTSAHGLAVPSERLFVLGGESRVVARREGDRFPSFETVREQYEQARNQRREDTPGLLLMLATPASFSTCEHDTGLGWMPPWLLRDGCVDGLGDIRFELAAVATGRFVPLSAWSLAHRDHNKVLGVQRAARRLVPAGTVYFLQLKEGGPDAWLRACERFWWRPIDETTPGNRDALLAAPSRDGYGMTIPGLWWPAAQGRKP